MKPMTNTVDLSKAKAGDTVKFRCGGEAVIGKISDGENADVVDVYFNDDALPSEYGLDGYHKGERYEHAFDITEVIPAPEVFDWGTVKAGMAFEYIVEYGVVIYVGIHPISKYHLFTSKQYPHAFQVPISDLTRSPEHDIKESV